jgi:hypothetical protein
MTGMIDVPHFLGVAEVMSDPPSAAADRCVT